MPLGLTFFCANIANAGTIFSASSVSADGSAEFDGSVSQLIDKSLVDDSNSPKPYTSGVTDFEAYVGTVRDEKYTPTSLPNEYLNDKTDVDLEVEFIFDKPLDVTEIAIWNDVGPGALEGFTLYSSASGDFSDAVEIEDLMIPEGSRQFGYPFIPDVVAGKAQDILGMRMEVTSVWGNSNQVRFNEVAFNANISQTQQIPIPSSLPLLFLGLITLCSTVRVSARRARPSCE
jgi:hypothetical protein